MLLIIALNIRMMLIKVLRNSLEEPPILALVNGTVSLMAS